MKCHLIYARFYQLWLVMQSLTSYSVINLRAVLSTLIMLGLSIQGINTARSYLWCTCGVLLADGSHLTLLLFLSAILHHRCRQSVIKCPVKLFDDFLGQTTSYTKIVIIMLRQRVWTVVKYSGLSLLMYVSINRRLFLRRNYRKSSSHVIPG